LCTPVIGRRYKAEGIWWRGIAFIVSGIITIIFGALMTKKTKKGAEL
jgi:hypothetical protein